MKIRGLLTFFSVLFCLLFFHSVSEAQITWEKTYGGSRTDVAEAVQQTTDGGYIVAGATNSFGAGSFDVYVTKLDALGSKAWDKTQVELVMILQVLFNKQ